MSLRTEILKAPLSRRAALAACATGALGLTGCVGGGGGGTAPAAGGGRNNSEAPYCKYCGNRVTPAGQGFYRCPLDGKVSAIFVTWR